MAFIFARGGKLDFPFATEIFKIKAILCLILNVASPFLDVI